MTAVRPLSSKSMPRSEAQKAKDAEAQRKRRAANPEYRESVRETERSNKKKWRSENPEKQAAQRRRQRTRRKGASGYHTARDLHEILQRQRGMCANPQCATELTQSNRQVDHIIAIANGGTNWPWNLQWLCRTCNRSKGTMNHLWWAELHGVALSPEVLTEKSFRAEKIRPSKPKQTPKRPKQVKPFKLRRGDLHFVEVYGTDESIQHIEAERRQVKLDKVLRRARQIVYEWIGTARLRSGNISAVCMIGNARTWISKLKYPGSRYTL